MRAIFLASLALLRAHSNHGTFYYNQLAALQILVGDTAGANQTLHGYFTTQFQLQIAANGDQVGVAICVVFRGSRANDIFDT